MSIFTDFIEDLKEQLSLALNNKKSSVNKKSEAENTYNYFLDFLAGEENSINAIIKLYYEEIEFLTKQITSYPATTDINTASIWINAILNELAETSFPTTGSSTKSDIFTGDYVPEIGNVSSEWLLDNSLSTHSETLPTVSTIQGIAPEEYYRVLNGTYSAGNTLKWKITLIQKIANAIYLTLNIAGGHDINYDDFKNDQTYLTDFSSVISEFEDYLVTLNAIKSFYDSLDGSAPIEDFGFVNLDVDATYGLNNIITALEGFVGQNTDALPTASLWAYYNYFEITENSDGSYLGNLGTSDSSGLRKVCADILSLLYSTTERSSYVQNTILGTNFTDDKIYKIRYKILDAITGNTQSPLQVWNNLNNSIPNIEDDIENISNKLLNNDISLAEQLPTPKFLATYYNPRYDKSTGNKLSERTGFTFTGSQSSLRHEIYRKEITEENKETFWDNTEWVISSPDITLTEINSETGNVDTFADDTGFTTEDYDKTFCYRAISFDTFDATNVSSKQSNIIDLENGVEFTEIINSVLILTEQDKRFIKDNFVLIRTDEASVYEGFYRIADVDEIKITLEGNGINIGQSGSIYFTNSIVQLSSA